MRITRDDWAGRRGLFADGDDEPDPGGPGGGGEPAPPPQFVPAEEFKAFQTQMTGFMETMKSTMEGMQAIAASRPAAPYTPAASAAKVITRAEYEQAVRDQDSGVIDAWHDQKIAALRRDHIDPLRGTGFNALGDLTKEVAIAKLPHYKKYQKEIDAIVDQLPAETKLSPQAYVMAHDAVVGRHHDELTAEAKEAWARSQTTPADAGTPGGTTGRDTGGGKGKLPTVEEMFGVDAAEALRSKGVDGDQWARRMGYKGGWKEYVELTQAQEKGAEA